MRLMRISGTLATAGVLLLAAPRVEAACTYAVDPPTVKVQWTAFKFTNKTGVSGGFNKANLSGTRSAKTLSDLARNLRMKIDGASIESGDPARNATVSEFFFQQFKPNGDIVAEGVEVNGDDKTGIVKIKITMNGTSQVVPFTYTIGADGAVEANGTIDMMDFALKPAYDTLHKACEEKHVGPDGVSKTWTTVDLKVTGRFNQKCG
jgi:polyisoprenoid-binding protein YceI